jgi:preprotein translocase subunit SecG
MIYGILLALLIIASVFLVIFILMQSDKGGGLAGTFGGMGGGMPFSGREAATILTKVTTGLAITFMVICIILNILSRNRAHTSVNSTLQKRAEKMRKIESQAASSVLNPGVLPAQQQQGASQPAPAQQKAPAKSQEGEVVTIPGLTDEPKEEKKK